MKVLLILMITLILIFYKEIANIIKDKSPDEQLVLVSLVFIFLAVLVFTLYRMNQIKSKTLIMTGKGFFIEPLMAEFWENINEYSWNMSADVYRGLFSGTTEGTSLKLFNYKGAWPKIYDLASYGMFFTPDQKQQVDTIFQHLGIKKTEELKF